MLILIMKQVPVPPAALWLGDRLDNLSRDRHLFLERAPAGTHTVRPGCNAKKTARKRGNEEVVNVNHGQSEIV